MKMRSCCRRRVAPGGDAAMHEAGAVGRLAVLYAFGSKAHSSAPVSAFSATTRL